jgi:hypothetical protein
MSDITFDYFQITQKSKYYLPIIVEEIYSFRNAVRVTDAGMRLSVGDVLVTSSHSKAGISSQLYVTEVEYVEDLFEDFILLDISSIRNINSHGHISDLVSIGDELKLLINKTATEGHEK